MFKKQDKIRHRFIQFCTSQKSSTPKYVEGHKDDLTLAEAVHLASKQFLYSATNGGLLEHTEISH